MQIKICTHYARSSLEGHFKALQSLCSLEAVPVSAGCLACHSILRGDGLESCKVSDGLVCSPQTVIGSESQFRTDRQSMLLIFNPNAACAAAICRTKETSQSCFKSSGVSAQKACWISLYVYCPRICVLLPDDNLLRVLPRL